MTEDDAGRWHLRIETVTGDAHGIRTIDAASCRELADSTALILSMPRPAPPEPTPEPGTTIPQGSAPADRLLASRPSLRPGPYASLSVLTALHAFAEATALSELGLTFGWASAREALGVVAQDREREWLAASHGTTDAATQASPRTCGYGCIFEGMRYGPCGPAPGCGPPRGSA